MDIIVIIVVLFTWAIFIACILIITGSNPNLLVECTRCGLHYWSHDSTAASYKTLFCSATCETLGLDRWENHE